MFGRSHPVLEAGRILQYEHSQNTRADITWTERKVSFSSHSYTNWESLSPFPFWSLQSFHDCEFRGFLPEPDIVSISSLTEGYIFSLHIYMCVYIYVTHTWALSGWVSRFGEVSDLCYTYSKSEELEVCRISAVRNLKLQLKFRGSEAFRMCAVGIPSVHEQWDQFYRFNRTRSIWSLSLHIDGGRRQRTSR